MQKIIFRNCAILYLVLFAFTSCRNDQPQNTTTEDNTQMTESARLDSLANDLEATKQTIEEQTKELQNALEALWIGGCPSVPNLHFSLKTLAVCQM